MNEPTRKERITELEEQHKQYLNEHGSEVLTDVFDSPHGEVIHWEKHELDTMPVELRQLKRKVITRSQVKLKKDLQYKKGKKTYTFQKGTTLQHIEKPDGSEFLRVLRTTPEGKQKETHLLDTKITINSENEAFTIKQGQKRIEDRLR
ncbi:MAG: hypothetical protein GOV15_04345 [Candidatus Diapherotrites archaeon]|nr:hypothetical protein [Candidatus Diapherotrites archaeon]